MNNPDIEQRGNILFLILIAVALFAALGYALTSSNRTGSADISDDKADAAASEIVQQLGYIRQTLTRMKLVNGCTDDQFNFTSFFSIQNNPNSPASKKCHVYDKTGGQMSPVTFAPKYFDSAKFGAGNLWITKYGSSLDRRVAYNANNRWVGIGTHANGVASVDMIGEIYGVSDPVCRAINKKVNLNPPTFAPPSYNMWVTTAFYGVYTDSNVFTLPVALGCIYNSTYAANFVVFPLIER